MTDIDFLTILHKRTQRDYLARVNEFPKAEATRIASRFDEEYWDGDRKFGYGGYRYDGRWFAVADMMAKHYRLQPGQRVLDVGCGKGFLLYELTQAVPGLEVEGIDISRYAIENAKEEVRSSLRLGEAQSLPYADKSFDLVISLTTLHNLQCFDLFKAVQEIERVGRGPKYIVVESYRNADEKVNLLYWQLTCQTFFTPDEWDWFLGKAGYTGDRSFIFFE